MLSGSSLTTAVNLAYNIVVAWFLGPTGFGHATVVYTLLTLLSAISLAFQIVSAKVVAQQNSQEGKAQVYRVFHRSACGCGLLCSLLLLLFQRGISDYLNLPDPVLVAWLAIGAAFYIPLGSRRGYIQGNCQFHRFAMNLVLEGIVRLGGSFLLIIAGFGVRGVIAANAAAIIAAYFAITPRLAMQTRNPLRFWYAFCEASQALFFFAGQMLINNCDIVLVKHLFPAQEAGLYAAVALVGRVMFTLSSSVVNSTFPIVAGTGEKERKDLRVIATSLLLVIGIGVVLTFALWITPARVWTTLLGAGFKMTGKYDLSYLSTLYALKTVIYSISAVIITFEMSYKIGNASWIQLIFSGGVIVGIYQYHSSLHQVILVQMALLSALCVCVAIPFFIELLSDRKVRLLATSGLPVTVVRRVIEDEVIAEFLKSELNCFKPGTCTDDLREIILRPNLDDPDENSKRRALFLTRHCALWEEIPSGTEWHEVKVSAEALDHIRVFPRAQWRKLARGNYSVTRVTERLRAGRYTRDTRFMAKIADIGRQLSQAGAEVGTIILLGMNERDSLVVLDGNHRLVAGISASSCALSKFRFMCGFSSRMTECCWYKTNIATLFRYGSHVLARASRNPREEIERLLHSCGSSHPSADLSKNALANLAEAKDVRL